MSHDNAVHFPRGASGHDLTRQLDHNPAVSRVRQSGSHAIYRAAQTGANIVVPDHRQPVPPGTRASIIRALIAAGIVVAGLICGFSEALRAMAR